MNLNRHFFFTLLGCSIICLLLSSCGSSEVTQNLSATERFNEAKNKFDHGDYLDAINGFEIIKLQFLGSTVADSAQYYLGECHYQQEEYLLAAQEYQALQRNFRSSPLVPMTLYKIAMCYYNLSPKSSLDQNYTTKAIDAFQSFIEYNPTHELVHDAEDKIKELNTRLSKKLFDSAQLYMKMEYYKSAAIYFSAVVEKYHDTQYAEPAQLGKVKALVARKKFNDAQEELQKFFEKYPNSTLIDDARSLKEQIQDGLKRASSASIPQGH